MAAKKVKGMKTGPGTRKRLTDEQKQQIMSASPDLTLQAIADEVGTTINTVSKYRKAGATKVMAPKGTPTVAVQRAGATKCPTAIAGILGDESLRDSQKVKMISAYYEV